MPEYELQVIGVITHAPTVRPDCMQWAVRLTDSFAHTTTAHMSPGSSLASIVGEAMGSSLAVEQGSLPVIVIVAPDSYQEGEWKTAVELLARLPRNSLVVVAAPKYGLGSERIKALISETRLLCCETGTDFVGTTAQVQAWARGYEDGVMTEERQHTSVIPDVTAADGWQHD